MVNSTDILSVNGIFVLLGLIAKILVMGFFTFVILHVLRSMKRRTIRDDLTKIEAKMASYRMNLQNRVKRKAKRFRSAYPTNISPGEPIDICLAQLADLGFEKNSDFQDYIDLCKKINNMIDLANAEKASETSHQPKVADDDKCDFMGSDFKNEINIVRLINDMVSVSKTLSRQVTRYNHFDRRAKLQTPDPISFASLFELQKVFQSKEANDELIEKMPEDHAKSA